MAKEVEGKESKAHEKGEVVSATVDKMPVKVKKGSFAFKRYSVEPTENGGLIVTVQPKTGMETKVHAFSNVEEADDFMDKLLGHED